MLDPFRISRDDGPRRATVGAVHTPALEPLHHGEAARGLPPGAALLLLDALGWRIVSPAFDRERLITGTR
jgi:hypothetical protein